VKRIAIYYIACITLLATKTNGQGVVTVAAASDLKFALDSIAAVFQSQHGSRLQITYGSSGKIFEQISNGAPFDIYFSADINYPNKLKTQNKAASDVYPYGIGRLVVWSKKVDPVVQGMDALVQPGIKKIAIANPAHAPYGQRAKEALIHYHLWDKVEKNLVYGENIAQTAQFVTSGAADIGIIGLSLALSPNMKRFGGTYFVIPQERHQPLLQGVVITLHGKSNRSAYDLFNFVQGDVAQSILNDFGFSRP
jgi:molybdate transport system substrate-binding protein